MKIVVLTKRGGARTLQLSIWALFVFIGLAVAAVAATAVQLHERYAQQRQVAKALADWRSGIVDQQATVASLQQQHTAENEAISKQLANMQGRLWRMEALGLWVTEASGLDAGEFDFAAPPAQGGPLSEVPADCARTDATQTLAACQEAVLPRTDLHARLNELAGLIRQREDEFELFEALLKTPPAAVGQSTNVRPVNWGWVSSPYGRRIDPISGKMAWHTGVDFAGRRGSDVIAVDRGIVVFAGYRAGYGNLVELAHLDGHVTRYGHQGSIAVSRGDIVGQGQVIGSMGDTGRSTGPHVHFEVLKNGRHRSPMKYLKDQSG
ncbi:MAG: M23 family metallopeptidase [Gammaproteobacteria bacterium]|nr:M23 family metallopeptidase [Gammaproteobacteria bacterium]MDD9962362.1 M23 family metallopeptidase [Gammaproteobacteria bacterium]MDE0274242.1 M23 family metallopeptidase [Gammaproteobacteria bacterium]